MSSSSIVFTPSDIAKIRIVATYGIYAEAMFAPAALRKRHRTYFDGWLRHADESVPWAAFRGLTCDGAPALDLFTLIGPMSATDEVADVISSAPASHLRTEMRATPGLPDWILALPRNGQALRVFGRRFAAVCERAIAPHWARIQAYVEAEATAQIRILAQNGVAAFFNRLNPDARWDDGRLRIHDGSSRPQQTRLNGRGLIVVPSVFCRRITLYLSAATPGSAGVLFYPALRELSDALRLWSSDPRSTSKSLSMLLGSTRAAVLDETSVGCTTSELSRRLGISPATASHHVSVLRDSGLITSHRSGKAVVHQASTLGLSLINGA